MEPCRTCGNIDFEQNGVCRICGTIAPRAIATAITPTTTPEPTPSIARRGSRPLSRLGTDPGATNPGSGHFCGRCGSAVDARSDFCGICGNPLNEAASERVHQQRSPVVADVMVFDIDDPLISEPGIDLPEIHSGGETQPQQALQAPPIMPIAFSVGIVLFGIIVLFFFLRH